MKNVIDHITLTVSSAAQSCSFYEKVLGWKVIEKGKDYGYLCPTEKKYPRSDFMLCLGEPRDYKLKKNNFDRNRIGLDHFAFAVETLEELKEIETRLKKENIPMEDDGITNDDFGGTGIFCCDPDGMKVEWHLKSSQT